jgi:hypothetical protein
MSVCERLRDDEKATMRLAAEGAKHRVCLGVVVGSAFDNLRALSGLFGRGN